MNRALLEVSHLSVRYRLANTAVMAVDDVSFSVQGNEIVGLVGESGSGKSTVAQAVLRLLSAELAEVTGEVTFRDQNILSLDEESLRRLRWTQLALVSQSSMNALNPLRTIAQHFDDVWAAHHVLAVSERRQKNVALLTMVNLDPVILERYPHQLSGGMRQRVAIALAMMFQAPFVIMDEPTTALDVLVERDILAEIHALQQKNHLSILFITHDLNVIFKLAHRLLIMYGGEIVEAGPTEAVKDAAHHPYTQGLHRSFLSLDTARTRQHGIAGQPPDMKQHQTGCRFAPRCSYAREVCYTTITTFQWVDAFHTHGVRCHYWREIEQHDRQH